MSRKKFTLWHSVVWTGLLLIAEAALVIYAAPDAGMLAIFFAAAAGAIGNIYVATEIIEEVRNAWHMLWLLSIIVGEFVAFFAFQYGLLLMIQPASFPTLTMSPVALFLHSIMVFVFNPLYTPATQDGQLLLIIHTLGALGLVLFILQNIGQFRRSL